MFKIQRGKKPEESILILTANGSKFTSEMEVQHQFGVVNDESDFNNSYFLVFKFTYHATVCEASLLWSIHDKIFTGNPTARPLCGT